MKAGMAASWIVANGKAAKKTKPEHGRQREPDLAPTREPCRQEQAALAAQLGLHELPSFPLPDETIC